MFSIWLGLDSSIVFNLWIYLAVENLPILMLLLALFPVQLYL